MKPIPTELRSYGKDWRGKHDIVIHGSTEHRPDTPCEVCEWLDAIETQSRPPEQDEAVHEHDWERLFRKGVAVAARCKVCHVTPLDWLNEQVVRRPEQDEAVRQLRGLIVREFREDEARQRVWLHWLDQVATPPPVPAVPHEHEWKREYAPGYRQASEANDWREECACGAVRTGTDDPVPAAPPLDVSDITRSMRETTATARSMNDKRVPSGWLNTIDQWADLIDGRVRRARLSSDQGGDSDA